MRVDLLFILSFTIVHFQWAIMLLLGFQLTELTHYFVDFNRMNYGVWLSTLGGVSWFMGFNLKNYFNKKILTHKSYALKFDKIKWFTLFFFVLFLFMAGSDFFNGTVYKAGEGGRPTGSGVSAYFQEFFSISILVYTGLIFLSYDKKEKLKSFLLKNHKIYILLVATYTTVFLFVGDRGGIIQLATIILLSFSYFIKPIKLYKLIIIISTGAIFMTIIGLGRGSESVFETGFKNINQEASVFAYTINLANSNRVLSSAINYVENNGLFFGKLMVGNILGAIPFSQSLYLRLTDIESYKLSSSSFFTYLKYGKNPPSGEGTTLIADIYINFGIFGVFLLMFLFGRVFSIVNKNLLNQNNIKNTIISLVIASSVIYIGRANILYSLKAVVWSLFILSFIKKKNVKKI